MAKNPNSLRGSGLAARWKMYADSRPARPAPKPDLCKVVVGKNGRKVIRCGREKRNFEHTQRAPECEGTLRYGCRLHDNVCGACAVLAVAA